MKTSLGIWALGPMITRFVPVGYQPEHANEPMPVKVRRAVDGLGDLMDDYEFHYPGELNPDNLDAVRDALDGHGIACICTGLHTDPRFGKGGLTSRRPRDARRGAPADPRDRRVRRLARREHDLLAGIEGYNYPFQTPYAQSWEWFIEGMVEAAEICGKHGVKLFLEHKNSEPAMKIFMRNIGMTLHVIHTLRAQGIMNVQVNMDWQHLIMNGESLGEYAAARRRGTTRAPARELGLGDVRRRQHGRRDRVHGDARAGARAAQSELRRERRAARLRSLPVHRGRRRGGRALRPAVELHRLGRRGRSTMRRFGRRRAGRTRCAPTSSCTRRSVRRTVKR